MILHLKLLHFYFPALDKSPVPENKKLNFSKACCCSCNCEVLGVALCDVTGLWVANWVGCELLIVEWWLVGLGLPAAWPTGDQAIGVMVVVGATV